MWPCSKIEVSPTVQREYYSLRQLSLYSGLSVRTLRGFISFPPSEALPVVRLPGKLLVRRADFDAFLAARTTTGKPSLALALQTLGLFQPSKPRRPEPLVNVPKGAKPLPPNPKA